MKVPGRLGDSPVIGAGNYCDNRYGGAACTGRGELTIRLLSARMIVKYMEDGLDLNGAVVKAFKEIHDLNETGGVNCIAIDNNGNAISASTSGDSTFWYMDVDSDEPEERPGIHVENN